MERFGSRNFFHYYEQMTLDTHKNLEHTVVGGIDGCFYVHQKLGDTSFVTCVRVLGAEYSIRKENDRVIKCVFDAKEAECCTLLVTTRINETVEATANKLRQIEEIETLYASHQKDWSDYWNRSFLSLFHHEYAENIYYLNLYQLRCSCLGKYPPTFGAIWTWNGDTRNWTRYAISR